MSSYRFQDIFVPGGFPKHTYNARAALNLEPQLQEALNNLCKLVTVTGQTKSGKTVLSKKVFPVSENIWVEGGSISQDDDFWQQVVDQLEGNQTITTTKTHSKSLEGSTESELGLRVPLLGGKIGLGAKAVAVKEDASASTKVLTNKVLALNLLRRSGVALIIDDFSLLVAGATRESGSRVEATYI